MPARIELFGIRIDALEFNDALEHILGWLRTPFSQCRYVVTPNVNHVVLYQQDALFKAAYERASLVLADGRYVVAASKLLGNPLPGPINGSDLVPALFQAAERIGGMRVFLLGAMPGVAVAAASNVKECWPSVDLVGVYSPPFGFERSVECTARIIAEVNAVQPDLVVIGISPPKQEVWISQHAAKLRAKVAICAGASIDFLAGHKSRAPRWMQRVGAEWVFRVLIEPRRLSGRYFADGVRFAVLLWTEFASQRRRAARGQ